MFYEEVVLLNCGDKFEKDTRHEDTRHVVRSPRNLLEQLSVLGVAVLVAQTCDSR